ncbi:MAG TPA: TIGR02444 family protein [Stellaceae bacterium]|nr:TIGR02444 family protein [Stellaceae bacterium]
MTDAGNQAETPFWRFSLRFYRQAGVAESCIVLQDEYGVDVNVLLFLLWLADGGRQLSDDDVKKLDDAVCGWRTAAVIPMRDIRRRLKAERTLIEAVEQETYRTKIKAIELEAERLQQRALYALSQATRLGKEAERSAAARANVGAYEQAINATFPHGATNVLFGAFDSMTRGEQSASPA